MGKSKLISSDRIQAKLRICIDRTFCSKAFLAPSLTNACSFVLSLLCHLIFIDNVVLCLNHLLQKKVFQRKNVPSIKLNYLK